MPCSLVRSSTRLTIILSAGLALVGCQKQNSTQVNYEMGERITDGPLVYNIIQTAWKSQLGDQLNVRTPGSRFLIITLSVTNSGGSEVSVPFLTLEAANGKQYQELQEGDGVDNWLGLLRTIAPAETRQGNLLFDVPLTSFRLRLTDGGAPGSEKFVWAEIPLRLDTDTSIPAPTPGQ